jgi:hypothetical protein
MVEKFKALNNDYVSIEEQKEIETVLENRSEEETEVASSKIFITKILILILKHYERI